VWTLQDKRLLKRGHHVITKKNKTMTKGNLTAKGQYKNTRYFNEPLFMISNASTGEKVAVIGASCPEEALEFCEMIRSEIALPPKALRKADYFPEGPVSGVGFWSSAYFAYLSSILDMLDKGELVCPACGR
jgi:hypothetical protein